MHTSRDSKNANKKDMSCSEACGIAALAAVMNLTSFSDVAVHFIAHSKSAQKTALSRTKTLAKINLEVL